MGIGLLFWVIYLVWVIFGFIGDPPAQPGNYWGYGRHFVTAILIGLIGWRVFGAAVHN